MVSTMGYIYTTFNLICMDFHSEVQAAGYEFFNDKIKNKILNVLN